jgi:hypothetical protein
MLTVEIKVNGEEIARLDITRRDTSSDGETAAYEVVAHQQGKPYFGFMLKHHVGLGATKLALEAIKDAREYGWK